MRARSKVRESALAGADSFLLLGVATWVLTVIAALAVSALFEVTFFLSWVGIVWMAAVPFQTVAALMWNFEFPEVIGGLRQPLKGLCFLTLTTLVALLVSAAILFATGNGLAIPGPQLVMFVILSISVALWWIVAWQGWPFTSRIHSPILRGVALTIACYPVTFAVYTLFFDFGFLNSDPSYLPLLDNGFIDAWTALIFAITSVSLLLLCVLLDFWGISSLPGAGCAWIRGVYLTVLLGVVAFILMGVFIDVAEVDRIRFMLWGPIATIFGFFAVTAFFQNRLFHKMAQPVRGFILSAISILIGIAMVNLYTSASVMLLGRRLASGAPTYSQELWVANSLLAITFPLIVLFTGSFEFWPLRRQDGIARKSQ